MLEPGLAKWLNKTETPDIARYVNTSNSYDLSTFGTASNTTQLGYPGASITYPGVYFGSGSGRSPQKDYSKIIVSPDYKGFPIDLINELEKEIKNKKESHMSDMRVVQIFIVDTDKNVPVESRLLHKSDTFFTDMTDQDLFFDIDIKAILTKHNALRTTFIDKIKSSATEKVYLEPVRISQLRMTVSVLAQF